ncbi:MAG: GNAT family N-acetyltransferase [Flavobacteriia bacterium]|nr:GNAT family N-acetyltransferase [Flavobacteriia bacterium]
MNYLEGKNIYLRAVEPSDAPKILVWENNQENWRVSNTEAPYSLQAILDHIHSIQNFRQSGELRLMICLKENNDSIGTLDLYDAHFKHQRVGIGILIADSSNRKKGYASESLELIKKYVLDFLEFHTIFAHILEDNFESIQLFEKAGFIKVGTKLACFVEKGKRINEHIYQYL